MFPSTSRPTGILVLFGAEKDHSDHLDSYTFRSLTIFVKSVLGFLPWCNSNGVSLDPVRTVTSITRNDLFTLSGRPIPSSKFAILKFSNDCIALSTAPFPVCVRSVQYFIIQVFVKTRYSLERMLLRFGFEFFRHSVQIEMARWEVSYFSGFRCFANIYGWPLAEPVYLNENLYFTV